MKRRHLLKYGTLTAWGMGLAACQRLPNFSRSAPDVPEVVPEVTIPLLDLEPPEKDSLALGYVPSLAIAPWLVALKEKLFSRYGLTVQLYPQPDQQAVEQGILESRFDAAITPFSTPLIYQLKNPRVDLVALMQIHRHGGVFCGDKKTWDSNIRAGIDYANFIEFTSAYRNYILGLPKKVFGIDQEYSIAAYLYRYWWGAFGFHPEQDIELVPFAPGQLRYKLESGEIQGYCSQEPWGQEAIINDVGFVQYLSADIWRGHPGPVITTSAGWLEKHPNSAQALMAATLQGCQYCQYPAYALRVGELLAEALSLEPPAMTSLLKGNYYYGGEGDRPIMRRDSPIWFDQGLRLPSPDQANYCWQSHGLWLLTQMVRWRHFNLRRYPKNAREIVAAAYPSAPYAKIAEQFNLVQPPQSFKSELHFIDQRVFMPNQETRYLSQFIIRT